MPRFPESIPVRVRVGDCTCPGTPHADGDFVTLEPKLTPTAGMAAIRALMRAGTEDPNVVIMAAVLPHSIREWTFLDIEGEPGKDGKLVYSPLPITPASVKEALPWTAGGFEVANRAVDLYLDQVTSPLASRLSNKKNSKPSPSTTTEPTSPKRSSSEEPRKHSAPSSPTTTDGTP